MERVQTTETTQTQRLDVNSSHYSNQVLQIVGQNRFDEILGEMNMKRKSGIDFTWQEVAHVYQNASHLLNEMSLYDAIQSTKGYRFVRGGINLDKDMGQEIFRSEQAILRLFQQMFAEDEVELALIYCGGLKILQSLSDKAFNGLIDFINELKPTHPFQEMCLMIWGEREKRFKEQ